MAKKQTLTPQPKEVPVTQTTQPQAIQALDEKAVVETVTDTAAETTVEDATVADTAADTSVAAEAPVETVAAPAEPAVVSTQSEGLTSLLAMCKATGNTALNVYVNELLDYANKMAPGCTMTQELGTANQAAFYTTLINLIDHTGKDFRIAFSTLLAVFDEYKRGAFSGAYALRFMEDVPLNKAKRDNFVKLVNLFNMTADAKTRKATLKHVDLKRELVGMSEESKMRLVAFYTA